MPRGRPKKQVAETKKLLETLTPQQVESIKDISKLLGSLIYTFQEFDDLNYSQVQAINNEGGRFHYLFREVIHND